jgi:hypothetical protein
VPLGQFVGQSRWSLFIAIPRYVEAASEAFGAREQTQLSPSARHMPKEYFSGVDVGGSWKLEVEGLKFKFRSCQIRKCYSPTFREALQPRPPTTSSRSENNAKGTLSQPGTTAAQGR